MSYYNYHANRRYGFPYGYGYGCGGCGTSSCSCSSSDVTCTSTAKLLTGSSPTVTGLDFAQHDGSATITSFEGVPAKDVFVLEWNGATPVVIDNQTSTTTGTIRTLDGNAITLNAARPRATFAYVSCQFMEVADASSTTTFTSNVSTAGPTAGILTGTGFTSITVTGGGNVSSITGVADGDEILIRYDGANDTTLQTSAVNTVDGNAITLSAGRQFVWLRAENGGLYENGPNVDSANVGVEVFQTNAGDGATVLFSIAGAYQVPVADLEVTIDGVMQIPGTDFTTAVNGTALDVTFTTAPAAAAVIYFRRDF